MFKGLRGRKLIIVIMSVLILSGLLPSSISADNKTVTIEIGEGHESAAGRFVAYFNEQYSPAVIAERESEESHVVTLTIGDGELCVKDILATASESLLTSVDESGFHNNQKPYRVAENDITHYRNKEEVLEEYNGSESSAIADGDVYYALWETVLDKVEVTIKNPLAGTQVTADEDPDDPGKHLAYTQDPMPEIEFAENKYHITTVSYGEDNSIKRQQKFYYNNNDDTDCFTGSFEAGKDYCVAAKIEPVLGYLFNNDTVLFVNEEQAAMNTYEINDDGDKLSLNNYLITAIALDDYEASDGYDDQIWLLGSSMNLEFGFKHNSDEEKAGQNFDHITVDSDEALDPDNYTLSGSLKITLKAEYLNTLAAGQHKLTAYFKGGKSVEVKFVIKDKNSNGLPIIVINITDGSMEEMNGDQKHKTTCEGSMDIVFPDNYSYIEKPEYKATDVEGLKLEIRGRGNSSWRMPKKPYKIKLDSKTNLFGMGKNKHWVLLANYLDKTLLKDRIVAYMSDKLSFDFTPECVNVEVYMNDVANGRQYYLGNYMLTEQVRVDDNRLEIDELKENDTDEKTITGGYLIQGGQQRFLTPDAFRTNHGALLANDTPSFDTGDDGYDNDTQKNYIRNHLQGFEDALYGEDQTNEEGIYYRDYVDLATAVDYLLINEFTANVDAYGTGSHYFYKVRDSFNEDGSLKEMGKIFYGPIWDYDKSFGEDLTDTIYTEEQRYTPLNEFILDDVWFKAMLKDPEFVKAVKERWKSTIRPMVVDMIADGGLIDQYYEENKKSQADDYAFWYDKSKNVYKEEIADLKERIAYRISYFDEHIDELDNMIHKVDFIIDGKLDKRQYYLKKEYVNLYKVEKEGYIFLGWLDENGNIIEETVDTSYDRTLTAHFVSKEDATKANEIIFLKKDVYGEVGDRLWPRFTLFPEDAQDQSVSWRSSNGNIASVDNSGTVTLKKLGSATITATLASGAEGSYTVTAVERRPYYESIEVPEKLNVKVGKHGHIEVKIVPEEADYGYLAFDLDDYSIATVDQNGVVKGLKTGQTDLTITANCFDVEKQKEIIVQKKCRIIVSEGNDYECVEGAGKEWIKGSSDDLLLVFRNKIDDSETYTKFRSLKMDNKDVAIGNYDVSKGSLRLKLKPSYLNTLSNGDHLLKVEFSDGDIQVRIRISERPSGTSYRIPVTGIE